MRRVEVRARIERPAEDVYAYATTVDTMSEWRGDISEAEQLTDGPIGVGTRIRAGGRVLGRPVGVVIEVTELEPGSRFGYRPVSGPLRTHNVYTFRDEAGGTLVTLTDDVALSGVLGLFEPLLARMTRRGYKANLRRMKAILEAHGRRRVTRDRPAPAGRPWHWGLRLLVPVRPALAAVPSLRGGPGRVARRRDCRKR